MKRLQNTKTPGGERNAVMREALETIAQRCASFAGEAPAARRRIARGLRPLRG